MSKSNSKKVTIHEYDENESDGSDIESNVDSDNDEDDDDNAELPSDYEEEDEEGDDDDDDQVNIKIGGSMEGNGNDDDDYIAQSQLEGEGDVIDDDADDADDEEVDENYLQKFDNTIKKNYIAEYHPECSINNYDEIVALTMVIRDAYNNIIDDLHKTLPYLTKYEKARVLGQRAKQINAGAKPYVKVPENIIDGYLVAEMELAQKRIPFIIRRPTPGGGCEYWNLKDLELIQF